MNIEFLSPKIIFEFDISDLDCEMFLDIQDKN